MQKTVILPWKKSTRWAKMSIDHGLFNCTTVTLVGKN